MPRPQVTRSVSALNKDLTLTRREIDDCNLCVGATAATHDREDNRPPIREEFRPPIEHLTRCRVTVDDDLGLAFLGAHPKEPAAPREDDRSVRSPGAAVLALPPRPLRRDQLSGATTSRHAVQSVLTEEREPQAIRRKKRCGALDSRRDGIAVLCRP